MQQGESLPRPAGLPNATRCGRVHQPLGGVVVGGTTFDNLPYDLGTPPCPKDTLVIKFPPVHHAVSNAVPSERLVYVAASIGKTPKCFGVSIFVFGFGEHLANHSETRISVQCYRQSCLLRK